MNSDVAKALWELHTTGRLGDESEENVREVLEIPTFTEEPEDETEASPQTKSTTTTGGKRT